MPSSSLRPWIMTSSGSSGCSVFRTLSRPAFWVTPGSERVPFSTHSRRDETISCHPVESAPSRRWQQKSNIALLLNSQFAITSAPNSGSLYSGLSGRTNRTSMTVATRQYPPENLTKSQRVTFKSNLMPTRRATKLNPALQA